MKPLAQKAVTIRGERWQVRVLADEPFFDTHGENCAAITLVHQKTIELPKNEVTFVTVLHEVFHAYASYLHLDSTQGIQPHQVEEIYAELFSNYGVQMINTTALVCETLAKKLKLETEFLLTGLSQDQRSSALPSKPRSRQSRKT